MRCYTPCYKHFFLLLLSSFFLLFPLSNLSPCYVSPKRLELNSFTYPGQLRAAPDASFLFLSFKEMYRRFGEQSHFRNLSNAEEWRERYCNVPKLEDVEDLLYNSSLGELEFLRMATMSESIPLNKKLRQNTFSRYLEKHKCEETTNYLVFAKRCEPHVLPPKRSWDRPKRVIKVMEALIGEAASLFPKLKSHYIKLRYLFQMVRLAHYAGKYEQVLELYDRFMPMVDHDPSQIEYWIEGHRAGALLRLGNRVESTYLYSRVFANCPGKRQSAVLSYKIRSDEEWEQAQLMAKDSKEKAAMYAMRGFGKKAKRVEEMKAIYKLDPENRFLEMLLEREILDLEPLLDRNMPRKTYTKRYLNSLGKRAIVLLGLVQEWVIEGKTKRPALWEIAKAYLEVLTGDTYAGLKSFARFKSPIEDTYLEDQKDTWQLVGVISSWTTMDERLEATADSIQNYHDQYLEHETEFHDFLYGKMASLYQREGAYGKAFLCQYPLDNLNGYPEPRAVNALAELVAKPDINDWERDLISIPGETDLPGFLANLKAMNEFKENKLELALESLNAVNPSEWSNYGDWDPFISEINDCVHCPVDTSRILYNRGEIIQELLNLGSEARGKPDLAARNYFRMGLAYYNMSYFGPAWGVLDPFRSGASIRMRDRSGNQIYPHVRFARGNQEIMDCSRALFYFDRARELASSPELAAQATFWAAKCEQNYYYLERQRGERQTFTFFNLLRSDYADTQFYDQVIAECKYFEAYTSR